MRCSEKPQEGQPTPTQKVDYKVNVELQIEFLDRIYTKTHQCSRVKGGMITHDGAIRMVLKEDLQKIKQNMFNADVEDFAKVVETLF